MIKDDIIEELEHILRTATFSVFWRALLSGSCVAKTVT